jgi:hypothetical protein
VLAKYSFRAAFAGQHPGLGSPSGDLRSGNQDGRPLRVVVARIDDGTEVARLELSGTVGVRVNQMEWADERSLFLYGTLTHTSDFGGASALVTPRDGADCFLMKLGGF